MLVVDNVGKLYITAQGPLPVLRGVDLEARDLVDALAERVDYPGFVDLTLRHDKVNTWL